MISEKRKNSDPWPNRLSRQFRKLSKQLGKLKPFAAGLVIIACLVFLLIIIYWAITPSTAPVFTGFGRYKYALETGKAVVPQKSLWDWMDLLIVPLVIAIGLYLLNQSARQKEQEIADNNRNQTTLLTYFDQMETLLLEKDLRTTDKKDVRRIARTRTLAVLRSLDGKRKGQVLQFLHEVDLITKGNVIVDLSGNFQVSRKTTEEFIWRANLREADLSNAKLSSIDLRGVDLSYANLKGAVLANLSLKGAILKNADLSGALIVTTDFSEADLTGIIDEETSFPGCTGPDGRPYYESREK